MAQPPRQCRKAAIPTPSRVADGGLLACPYRRLGSPRPTGRNISACSVVFSASPWRDTQVPPYIHCRQRVCIRRLMTDSPRRPPHRGAAGAVAVGRRLRHLWMALETTGDFARCGGRPGRCPLTLRFFEKNRVKLLSVFLCSQQKQARYSKSRNAPV